jgi:ATP-dependent Lhr-like helicase
VVGALAALEDEGRVVRGEFRPDGVRREWCDTEVLRQLRRRSLAALRREVEPVEQDALARFLPAWHGIPPHRRGVDGVVEALGLLAGAPLVASTLERDVLPARVDEYRPSQLDELCTAGDVVWVGAGAIGSNDGRVRLCFADQLPLLAPGWERSDPPAGELHEAIRVGLAVRGASFWNQLRATALGASDTELLAALWDLVWAGEVTNDSLAPLRAITGSSGARAARRQQPYRGRPRPGRLARIGPPAGAGRWSLVAPLLEPVPPPTEAAHATALQLVERHGVVTREAVLAEGVVGGYASVYGILKVLEERGQVRRGYFVSGLGAAQFALPGAVDRLRQVRERADDTGTGAVAAPVVLAATDPSQPYGAALSWPETVGRPARTGGALVVMRDGLPLAWYDRRSFHLVTFAATLADRSWAEALADQVRAGRVRKVEIRKVDGDALTTAPTGREIATAAKAAGFVDSYRGLVFQSPSR